MEGFTNFCVTAEAPARLRAAFGRVFDAVLVDAPCSGEGMFRRDPQSRSEWSPASPEGCARRQAGILDCAARMLRPGGRLVYSTCTFNAAENEGSVEGFLARHPEFAPEAFQLPGVGASSNGTLRLLPSRVRGDGHFVAKLRKSEGKSSARREDAGHARCGRDIAGLLERLSGEVCRLPDFMTDMAPLLQGDRLYCRPQGSPRLDGLRVISPGLCLLRVGRNHIEPEHALAMALPPECALRRAELDEDRAVAWLRGETLPLEGEKGWTLALYQGLPLGWGKASEGMLKNHLPKGLRRNGPA